MKKLLLSSVIAIAFVSCKKEIAESKQQEVQAKQDKQAPACPEITQFSFTSFVGELGNTKLRIDLKWINKNHKPKSIEIVIGGVSTAFEPTTEDSFTVDIFWIAPQVVTVKLYNGKIGTVNGEPCFVRDTQSTSIQ